MKVVAYGFEEKAEIGFFRMRDPMRVMQEEGLAEVRSTETMGFPKLLGGPDTTAQGLRQAHIKTQEDLAWADLLFTQRYIRSSDVSRLGPMADKEELPHILDIDDHILELDAEKSVYDQYANVHPNSWGQTRAISDPTEAKEGEVCMRHDTGELLAVTPQRDYVRGLQELQVVSANALICGTRDLMFKYDKVRRDAGSKGGCYHIPYSVDPKRWEGCAAPHDHPGEVWIGWLGADEHEKDFKLVAPAVEEILGKYPNVRFFWKRARVPELLRLATEYPERCVRFMRWVERDKWVDYCSETSCDILLAPLVSTPFNDCRSPMKWIEAAMLKTPSVCSDTWGYRDAITHRKTGILCSRPKHWAYWLGQLIENKDMREAIGGAAHEAAMKKHNLRKTVHDYARVFKEVIGRAA